MGDATILDALVSQFNSTNEYLEKLRADKDAYIKRISPYDSQDVRDEFKKKRDEVDNKINELSDIATKLDGMIAEQESGILKESAQALVDINDSMKNGLYKITKIADILKIVNVLVQAGLAITTGNVAAIPTIIEDALGVLKDTGILPATTSSS